MSPSVFFSTSKVCKDHTQIMKSEENVKNYDEWEKIN